MTFSSTDENQCMCCVSESRMPQLDLSGLDGGPPEVSLRWNGGRSTMTEEMRPGDCVKIPDVRIARL